MNRLSVAPLLLAATFLTGCQHVPTAEPPTSPASRLETTPRHDEWVDLTHGERTLRAYVVYPQRSSLSPVVVVIHENRGLNDWARSVADRLAEEGYIAIAPDFLSGTAPNGGGTRDYPSEDAAREGISRLARSQVMADLQATVDYARRIPAADKTVSVAGFCWGGSRAWDAANTITGLEKIFVFYGGGPQEPAGVAQIKSPVYGFYGGDDARVNATIPQTQALMAGRQLTFDPVIYDGAGHAFMRLGEQPDASEANRRAYLQAWGRWLRLLR
ncbi:MAG TPA: dienelactone hydrolase family protein [Thermoanaerobaculia bacterium]